MIDIIPSILVSDQQEFLSQISGLNHATQHLQLDIADGKFVPNTTWAEPNIIEITKDYTFELHLMVQNPLEVISDWKNIPNVTRFIIHTESVENLAKTIKQVRAFDKEIFIALKPETSFTAIEDVIDEIDGILFMGVNPGFQGQKLIPAVLEKIAECREKYPDLYTELDGGVQEDTLEAIVKSGVHAICPGSLVFKRALTPSEQILFIKNKLAQLEK
jgi:ribulose-phosphate 3-epimerase